MAIGTASIQKGFVTRMSAISAVSMAISAVSMDVLLDQIAHAWCQHSVTDGFDRLHSVGCEGTPLQRAV